MAAHRWCRARNYVTGVWSGEQMGNTRGVLCFKNNNRHVIFLNVAKSVLNAFSRTNHDLAALSFARSRGYEVGFSNFVETARTRGVILLSSSLFTWTNTYTSLVNSFVSQDCAYNCLLFSGCEHKMLGNGVCDSQCNNAACQYDRGDCSSIRSPPDA